MPTRIVFASVGNSACSLMAEAFCRALRKDVICASVDSEPETRVPPEAVAAMKEVGVDISHARPKGYRDMVHLKSDYLVTMGCDVGCPTLFGAEVVHWEIPDPDGGGVEQYRRVRNAIRWEVASLLAQLD